MSNHTRLFPIDLQLFAASTDPDDDLLLIDGDLPDEDEEEDDLPPADQIDKNLPPSDAIEPLDDDSDPAAPTDGEDNSEDADKREKALIHWKRQAKEANKKLQEAERKLAEDQARKDEEKRVSDLVSQGYTEDAAKVVAAKEHQLKAMEARLADMTFRQLESTYPGISKYRDQILEVKAKHPDLAEDEIYLAKYAKRSEFENRTQIEQEMVHRSTQSRDRGRTSEKGTIPKEASNVKLSAADERAYQLVKKTSPGLSRKAYLELLDD